MGLYQGQKGLSRLTLRPERLTSVAGAWTIIFVCVPVFFVAVIWPRLWLSAISVAAPVCALSYAAARAYSRRYRLTVADENVYIERGIILRRRLILPKKRLLIAEQFLTPVSMLCRSRTVILRAGNCSAVIVGLSRNDADRLLKELGWPQ